LVIGPWLTLFRALNDADDIAGDSMLELTLVKLQLQLQAKAEEKEAKGLEGSTYLPTYIYLYSPGIFHLPGATRLC
jgi:hypothetical protein